MFLQSECVGIYCTSIVSSGGEYPYLFYDSDISFSVIGQKPVDMC